MRWAASTSFRHFLHKVRRLRHRINFDFEPDAQPALSFGYAMNARGGCREPDARRLLAIPHAAYVLGI